MHLTPHTAHKNFVLLKASFIVLEKGDAVHVLVLKPELEEINLRLIQADANFYGPQNKKTNI